MIRIFSIGCAIILSLNLSGQEKSDTCLFKGHVITEQDSTTLTGVHVINLSSLSGTISDDFGEFDLYVTHRERVLFSYLGFRIDTILIDTAHHCYAEYEQVMKETSYMLSIFKALSIETFEEFKEEFLALELPDEQLNFKFPTPIGQGNLPDNQAFTIAIPFDLSYFSKKAKDYRRYRAMMEEDSYRNLVYERYNPEVIEMVTGMHDKQKIKELMNYCNFSDQFIINSVDYDLYVAIIKCSKTFTRKQKENKVVQED